MRKLAIALAVLAPLAARADVSLDLEATLGAPRLGMERLPREGTPLPASGDLGGAVLLRLGPLGVGAAADRTSLASGERRVTESAMGGLVTDLLPFVRLELLGEVGAAEVRGGSALPQASRFYGARPGLSLRLPVVPVRVGAWGLARWGLPGFAAGKPAYGMLFRAGLEF